MTSLLRLVAFVCLGCGLTNTAIAQTSQPDAEKLRATVELLVGDLTRLREEMRRVDEQLNGQIVSRVPVGTVVAYAGENLADLEEQGWLLCDGRELVRSEYFELFRAIGAIHGASSSTAFFLPDYRGRFLRGVANESATDPDKSSRQVPRQGATSPGNGGNRVGSVQSDSIGAHGHSVVDPGHTRSVIDSGHNHTITDRGHTHGVADPGHAHGLPRGIIGARNGGYGTGGGNGGGDIHDIPLTSVGNNRTGVTIQSASAQLTIASASSNVTIRPTSTAITIERTGTAESRPVNAAVNWIIRAR